jgi:tRNA 2-thiouridine synthesizing protein D
MAKLTIALMDSPYESGTTTTAMRIVDAAVRKGHSVNVFAYEGAVSLTMKEQKAHPNPVKGTSVEEQKHPTTANFVAGLLATGKVDWINCGMCVDERGAGNWIEGARRGGPADLLKWANDSTNTLIMGSR